MQSTIMPSTQMAVKEYGYFAGNQWRNAVDNQVFEVHEPYSGKLFARVAAGTRADGCAAVDAAARAFAGWADTTPGWGRTGPRSLDDFSDLIWINSHSGQRQYPF